MECSFLLLLLVFGSCGVITKAYDPSFYVNNVKKANGSTVTLSGKGDVTIRCYYDFIHKTHSIMSEVDLTGRIIKRLDISYSEQTRYYIASYSVPSSEESNHHMYSCSCCPSSPFWSITITVKYTTSSGHTPPFTGLNPLIYTVSAVFLMGSLAIVAIIACWIRARRSLNRTGASLSNAPQDYLDYINDEEFTPLTTSEFVASLQERPPSYMESERMELSQGSGERRNEECAPTATTVAVQRPSTVAVPRPPTVAAPRPPTVAVPRPPTVAVPRPLTVAVPRPTVTVPRPPTVAVPRPPTVSVPRPPTVAVPRPPTVTVPRPPTVAVPRPPTVAVPRPPTVAIPRPPSNVSSIVRVRLKQDAVPGTSERNTVTDHAVCTVNTHTNVSTIVNNDVFLSTT